MNVLSFHLCKVVLRDPIDWMNKPEARIVIQGLLRPTFMKEQSIIQKHISSHQVDDANVNQVEKILEDNKDLEKINGHELGPPKDSSIRVKVIEKDYNMMNEVSFYKLEMIKILLISTHGHHVCL